MFTELAMMETKNAQMLVIICLCSILYFCETEGAIPPPGLTSLRKCVKFHHFNMSEEGFTPLTKEQLDSINEKELDYSLSGYGGYAGGRNALPTQLPFMAALGYENGDRKEFVCGGILISEYFVLTAAHCIYSRSWGKVRYIRLGDLNLTSSTDDIGAQEFQLKEFYVHPDYKFPIKYNDIALIKLDRPAVFTKYVSPACLESERSDMRFQILVAAGWGHLGHGEKASDHLQIGTLRHYPGTKCEQNFPQEPTLPEGVKHESQICAGAYAHLADTCEGDSGGPLAYKVFDPSFRTENFVYMIAGVTSFGKACAVAKIPAIYTRVSYYTSWIEKTVWPNEFIDVDPHRIHFPST